MLPSMGAAPVDVLGESFDFNTLVGGVYRRVRPRLRIGGHPTSTTRPKFFCRTQTFPH